MKPFLRAVLRCALLAGGVGVAGAAASACSGDRLPAGLPGGDGGATLYAEGGFTPGGACAPEGATKKCGVKLGDHNGVLSCFEGTAACVNGAWGPCGEVDGKVTNYKSPSDPKLDPQSIAPGLLRLQSLSSPGSCSNNPCDPGCNIFNEQPPDGGITPGDGGRTPIYTWTGGSLTNYPPALTSKAFKEPCQSGNDCQFDYQCVNVSTGSQCAHSKCVTGTALGVGCDPCVDLVCKTNSSCCGGTTCAHPVCEVGVKLDSNCSSCATLVCAAHPECCTTSWSAACLSYVSTLCPANTCGCAAGETAFNGHCYYFNDTNLSWDAARAQCQTRGNGSGWDLAAVSDQGENAFIQGKINDDTLDGSGTWFGFNDQSDEGTWIWSNGDAVTYTNWTGQEPNGSTSENCAVIRQPDSAWEDRNCSGTYDYVCEGPHNTASCPTGALPYNGECYMATTAAGSWSAARTACQGIGTGWDLAVVNSAAENTNIQSTITANGDEYWIGYSDDTSVGTTEGNWVSVPGAGGATTPNWRSQPDGSTTCTWVSKTTGTWFDDSCSPLTKNYACEGPQNSATCPPGEELYNGHCYYFATNTTDWTTAQSQCAARAGGDWNLVQVDDAAESNFIKSKAQCYGSFCTNNWYWIGLNDTATEGSYVWADGTAMTYSEWKTGEPNNSGANAGENCAEIYKNNTFSDGSRAGRWNDTTCGNSLDSVCEGPTGSYTVCGVGQQSYGGHCYVVSLGGTLRTRDQARAQCPSGYDLVKIDDAAENTFILGATAGTYNTWIGLDSVGSTTTWKWLSDGSTFSAWGGLTVPSANTYDTVYLGTTGTWTGDNTTNTHRSYVCEGLPTTQACPSGYVQNGSRCYLFDTGNRTWSAARTNCQTTAGFDLATVDDATENAYIQSNMGSDSWLGYTDAAVEGSWVWQSGSSTYTNWHSGEPNNSGYSPGEDCVEFDRSVADATPNRRWNDMGCTTGLRSVCEHPAPPPQVCPTGAVANGSECYYFGTSQTRVNAETACTGLGTGFHLVTVDDLTENTYVQTQSSGDFWIGLSFSSAATPTGGTWANGSSSYRNWDGEPNGGSAENCASFSDVDAKWADHACSTNQVAVCEGPQTAQPPCNTGAGEIDHNGECYYFSSTTDTHDLSAIACGARGAGWTLAAVDDGTENAFIESHLATNDHAWIGFTDVASEGNWIWENGDPVFYTNWAGGNGPISDAVDCGRIYDNGKWDQDTCTLAKDSVCEGPGTQAGGTWAQPCVDLVKSTCDATCGTGSPPPTNGTCSPWLPSQTESWCTGYDLAVGAGCKGEKIPLCNQGTQAAPAGVTIAWFDSGSGQYPKSAPDLAMRRDTPGTCKATVPIPAGECVTITCPGIADNAEIMVNPPDATHVAECSSLDNWGLYSASIDCGPPDCSGAASSARLKKVNMYIMLDKSGSMGTTVTGGGTRWQGATSALKTFFQASTSSGIGVALEMFGLAYQSATQDGCGASDCDPVKCQNPLVGLGTLDTASGDPQETALINAMAAQGPGGSTPSLPAAQGAINWAVANQAAHPDEVFVAIYVTDGEPTSCLSGGRLGSAGATNLAIATAAGAAYDTYGVRTYTIGMVGSNVTDLNNIAAKGGTGQAFVVGDGAVDTQLLAALQKIAGDNVSCDFDLPNQGLFDPALGNVQYVTSGSQTTLAKVTDAAACGDGWYFDDPTNPTKVTLCPTTCSTIRTDPKAHIEVHMGCPSDATGGKYHQTYQAQCPPDEGPQWGYLSWDTTTPTGTKLDFRVRSASTLAGLGSASWMDVGSVPTDPQVCNAGVTSCPKDLFSALQLPGAIQPYLELEIQNTPNGPSAPVVKTWQITYSCKANK